MTGCLCNGDYIRDHNGICVLPEDCFTKLGKENEEYDADENEDNDYDNANYYDEDNDVSEVKEKCCLIKDEKVDFNNLSFKQEQV